MKNTFVVIVMAMVSMSSFAQVGIEQITGTYTNPWNAELEQYEGWREVTSLFIGNIEYHPEVRTFVIPATNVGGYKTRIVIDKLTRQTTDEFGTATFYWLTTVYYDYNDADTVYDVKIVTKVYKNGTMGLLLFKPQGLLELTFNSIVRN